MANGRATITFDGINLDNCIKQGLVLTGYAKCPFCKQIYTFQIHLNKKEKLHKYIERRINEDTVTVPVVDTYNVSIEFSANQDLPDILTLLGQPEESDTKKPCVPCSRCTPRCERLGNKW